MFAPRAANSPPARKAGRYESTLEDGGSVCPVGLATEGGKATRSTETSGRRGQRRRDDGADLPGHSNLPVEFVSSLNLATQGFESTAHVAGFGFRRRDGGKRQPGGLLHRGGKATRRSAETGGGRGQRRRDDWLRVCPRASPKSFFDKLRDGCFCVRRLSR